MSKMNVAILAVARKNVSMATNYEKVFFKINDINLCINNPSSLCLPKSPLGRVKSTFASNGRTIAIFRLGA